MRFEWENGIKEQQNRAMLWFDPLAQVTIAAAAQAAYARNPIPEVPVSQFIVQGGSVYAGVPGYDDRTWKPEALWMPRVSLAHRLGEKTVIKTGYGVYYDTLNARDWTPNQNGYDVTTINPLSNDFGLNFALGDPKNGILPLADPFPVRASTGSRYELVPGNSLGFDSMLGRGFTAENPNRVHSINRVDENRIVEEYDREPTLWQTNNNGRPWRVVAAGVYELPFGQGKPFLSGKGIVAAIASGWTLGGTFEYQPGILLNWNNLFFSGDLNNIRKDKPEIALQPDGTFDPTKTWFNIDAGFERDTADQPAAFQKRAFPFRVDGVRGFDLSYLNASFARTFRLGGSRTFQFRLDVQNLLNRQHYANPDMNPTSTTFGQVRAVNNNVMRFLTFNFTYRF